MSHKCLKVDSQSDIVDHGCTHNRQSWSLLVSVAVLFAVV